VPVYRALCRSLVVNSDEGSVFFTTVDGLILRYVYDRDALEILQGEDMKKDYFGSFDPNQAFQDKRRPPRAQTPVDLAWTQIT
jgi:hypothetical protein